MFAKGRFDACAGLRGIALITTALVCPVAAVAAEDSVAVRSADTSPVRARPNRERRVFFVTNAGAYVGLAGGLGTGRPVRGILDWGIMVNRSPKNAVGGSWFVAGDDDGLSTGPVLRWRRWLGPTRSLDVAVGTPIVGTRSVGRGSVLGLVKYNPVEWFGVAARPELVRHSSGYVASGMKAQLYLGAEFGGKKGLILGAVTGGAYVVLLAAFVASGGIQLMARS